MLRESFVSLEVDREERPDVDRVYMTFVQATTGSGGWPMSVFLTPGLEPFLGGTYFPPSDRYGRPGFKTILRRIAEVWRDDRQGLLEQGRHVLEALRQHATASAEPGDDLTSDLLEPGFRQIARWFDPEHGGFSDAPKIPEARDAGFPLPVPCACRLARARPAADAGDGAAHPPQDGRGRHARPPRRRLHRYSVDTFWHVPHFENMLYDHAQIVGEADYSMRTCRRSWSDSFRAWKRRLAAWHSSESGETPASTPA